MKFVVKLFIQHFLWDWRHFYAGRFQCWMYLRNHVGWKCLTFLRKLFFMQLFVHFHVTFHPTLHPTINLKCWIECWIHLRRPLRLKKGYSFSNCYSKEKERKKQRKLAPFFHIWAPICLHDIMTLKMTKNEKKYVESYLVGHFYAGPYWRYFLVLWRLITPLKRPAEKGQKICILNLKALLFFAIEILAVMKILWKLFENKWNFTHFITQRWYFDENYVIIIFYTQKHFRWV